MPPDSNADPYQPHRPVAGKPIISAYPTPDFNDRFYKVHKETRAPGYCLPDAGDKFDGPDAEKYKDFLFCVAIPSDQTGWTDWIYVNERLNQDAYNYTVEYPWEDEDWPRITRTYVTLRSKYTEPDPEDFDSAHPLCVLVDQKETRLEDPALNVLFVGVTKVYERIPAETEVVLDRADSVLPFNMRTKVPGLQVTTVEKGAVGTGDVPEIVDEEDWNISDTTRTVFSRQRKRTKRVIPNGSVFLDKGFQLTPDQQLARRKETWAIGGQRIIPRATTIKSTIEDIGNNTTVKDELVVDRVYPELEFRAERPDMWPPEFRAEVPTLTSGVTTAGDSVPPTLSVGELERVSKDMSDLKTRKIVVSRDVGQLPKTLHDFSLGGEQARGSEFGGIIDNARTLSAAPDGQPVEQAFEIFDSTVKNLGGGLTLRETKRLSEFQGPYLLLTNPGEGFVCDPAVLFDNGSVGSDAAATATVSTIPGGAFGDEDIGGIFDLNYVTSGDENGVFNFLAKRYNNGVWRNPFTYENIRITYAGHPSFPVSDASLAQMVDRENTPHNVILIPLEGGGHYFAFDMGVGKKLKANRITLKSNPSGGRAYTVTVEGFNEFSGQDSAIVGVGINIPPNPNIWTNGALDDTEGFRYFRIFATNDDLDSFGFSEVEFYGELSIRPAAGNLNWTYDGDDKGVFFYLGKRGGSGVWRNPSTNGDIVTDANGLTAGTLDELVDRLPSNIYTDENPARAYYFDLKAGRSLVCNKISYRQRTRYGSSITSFNLQGRNDLGDPDDWTDLVVVRPSREPDVWTTVDVPITIGYRQFRIITADAFFTVGEVELYGSLDLAPPGGGGPIGAVTGVTITNGGHDYLPTGVETRFIGGGGTGVAGNAVVENGVIIRVDLTSPGQNYTSAPEVRFFVTAGGKNAVANGIITGDEVTEYTIVDGGQEYGAAPAIEIIGDGTGATATATVSPTGQVIDIVPVTVGSGYTTATVLFRNAGGPTAIADVGYGIASITIDDRGDNYGSAPGVDVQGDGSGFQAHSILGFPVASVVINNRGQNYTSTPGVVFSSPIGGGTVASGTAVRGFPVASVSHSPDGTLFLAEPTVNVSGGGIYGFGAAFRAFVGRPLLSIVVLAQGSLYSSNPGVVIAGDGTGATADSFRSFAVADIDVDVAGSSYTVAEVVIDPPTGANGIQATAHAVIGGGGVISGIVVDNFGFGYLTTPLASIVGDGTSAAISVDLETSGAIDHIEITAAGTGFSDDPPVSLSGGGGSGAEISAQINRAASGTIVKVEIVTNGSGYTVAPTLSITGTTAPVATLSTSGGVVAVTLIGGGLLYTQNANVTFSGGGGGTGASGTGILGLLGKVKTVIIDVPGEGFTTTPTMQFIGGGGTDAEGTVVLQPTGKIKTLTLIDPGPQYAVAPLVSFFGCSGTGATALYILGTGFPILYDTITDPIEGIVVNIEKKIVPAGAVKPPGYVDIFALNKYRSIQLTSRVDLSSLPAPEEFGQSHVLNLPPLLLSVGAIYSRDKTRAVHINTGFGSASVKSTVRGKIVVTVQDGYKGPARASVRRTFLSSAPTVAQTPEPLVITPSTGTVFLTTRHQHKSKSGGTTGGFSYEELSDDNSESQDTLDIGGVLTGGLSTNGTSGPLIVNAFDIANQARAYAIARGIIDSGDLAQAVGYAQVSSKADLIFAIPPSCPQFLAPGTTFLLSAGVEKWRFGIYVQTLIYVTIPCPCLAGSETCEYVTGGGT